MHEYKFRAWDKVNNRMLYTDWNSPHNWYTESRLGKVAYERRFDGEQIQLSEPEQFTGLRDEKRTQEFPEGQEIYEGDIVERPDGRRCQVIWWNTPAFAGWDLMTLNRKGSPPTAYSLWRDWTVIGNIHDNPELLEGS